jgi:hypothetical protein
LDGLLLNCWSGYPKRLVRSAITKRTLGCGGGEFRRVGGCEHGVDNGLVLEFLVAELADMLRVDVFLDGAKIADAELGGVGAFVEIFVAVLALGLEFAEFGGAFVEQAVGECSCTVDGELEAGGCFLLHRVLLGWAGEIFFDLAAAAEPPHGAADFVGEIEFEHAYGGEIGVESLGEFGVGGLLVGADEVAGGEEAEGDGVLRGGGFTGFCARAAAVSFFWCDFGCVVEEAG